MLTDKFLLRVEYQLLFRLYCFFYRSQNAQSICVIGVEGLEPSDVRIKNECLNHLAIFLDFFNCLLLDLNQHPKKGINFKSIASTNSAK